MNKLLAYKRFLIKDIIIAIIFILVSIPVWLSFDVSEMRETAKYYENYNYVAYEYLNDEVKFSNMGISDELAKNIDSQNILVYNASNTKQDYNLLLKINKNEDVNNMKVSLNSDIKMLSNYEKYEDGDYFFYILDNRDLVASSQEYLVSIWNNNSIVDKTIDSKIMVG